MRARSNNTSSRWVVADGRNTFGVSGQNGSRRAEVLRQSNATLELPQAHKAIITRRQQLRVIERVEDDLIHVARVCVDQWHLTTGSFADITKRKHSDGSVDLPADGKERRVDCKKLGIRRSTGSGCNVGIPVLLLLDGTNCMAVLGGGEAAGHGGVGGWVVGAQQRDGMPTSNEETARQGKVEQSQAHNGRCEALCRVQHSAFPLKLKHSLPTLRFTHVLHIRQRHG
jgi:hypothetical protein